MNPLATSISPASTWRHRAAVWASGLLLGLGAVLPAHALGVCSAPPVPESRTVTFEPTLFGSGGAELSAAGRAKVNGFVQGLAPATLEAVVISVPVPAGQADVTAQARARLRANALRLQLVAEGVPRDQIYLEQREARVPAHVAMAAPLVVEIGRASCRERVS
jgi:hypothetical protein